VKVFSIQFTPIFKTLLLLQGPQALTIFPSCKKKKKELVDEKDYGLLEE